MTLLLRELRLDDEPQVWRAQRELALDDFVFAFHLESAPSFADYVETLAQQRRGERLSATQVPATFLVAEVAGQIVGRLSFRHTLNDKLQKQGGHIGFGVLREQRGRGYATEILKQALSLARTRGLDRVLLTCEETNLASRRVIEKCGGRYEGTELTDGRATRRYWIQLDAGSAD